MLEAVTSVSADSGGDKTQLQNAVQAAIADVAANAVAFTPTVVAVLDAKVIGIYPFVLVADKEGEEVIKVLSWRSGAAQEPDRSATRGCPHARTSS